MAKRKRTKNQKKKKRQKKWDQTSVLNTFVNRYRISLNCIVDLFRTDCMQSSVYETFCGQMSVIPCFTTPMQFTSDTQSIHSYYPPKNRFVHINVSLLPNTKTPVCHLPGTAEAIRKPISIHWRKTVPPVRVYIWCNWGCFKYIRCGDQLALKANQPVDEWS